MEPIYEFLVISLGFLKNITQSEDSDLIIFNDLNL